MLKNALLFWLPFSLFVCIFGGSNVKIKYQDRYRIKHWPNQENWAISRALQTVPDELSLFPFRKPLLCVTFLNASNNISRKILHANLHDSKGLCDWAVILYSGRRLTLCRSNRIRHCAPPLFPETVKHRRNMTVLPKSLLYFDLLPLLWEYQYAFLLDEDIALNSFNFTQYQRVLETAFQSPQHPDYLPPMISQGLINVNSQMFPYLNLENWQDSSVIAAEVLLIEQQIPFFNSLFLTWFIDVVIRPTIPKIIETESSWGPDSTWCGAAFQFARDVLHYDLMDYVPCAIILQDSVVIHHHSQTIQTKKKDPKGFLQRGIDMHEYFRSFYPTWNTYQLCFKNTSNPLHVDSIVRKVYASDLKKKE